MFAFLLRILLYFMALVMAGRFLRSLFHSLRGPAPSAANEDPSSKRTSMVKDPMCGMYMDPRLALRMEYKKESVYFCSDECRQKFLSAAS